MKQFSTQSAQDTVRVAQAFALTLRPGDIVFLQGELGAGKTTFTKGLAKAFHIDPASVTSPTFVIMNAYEGKVPIYHFDFYRLEKPEELLTMNLDEYFYGQGISVIEWPERLGVFTPERYIKVHLVHQGENQRNICIS